MPPARIMLAPLVVAAAGCAQGTSIVDTEVGGTPAERVAAVERSLRERLPALPSPILDAHRLYRTHNNGFGPPDFFEYALIEVAPADVASWRKLLTTREAPPSYEESPNPPAWWVDRAGFGRLRFSNARPLSERANGWTGVDESTGRIYVFSYRV